jgi:hypothetical protein
VTSSSTYPPAALPDASFVALARTWVDDAAPQLLRFVWTAYDNMQTHPPAIDGRDLERSITQLLEPRIRNAMTGDEPFYIQHGSFERESMALPPAQPPCYDLAFVLRADERVLWPLEAKVLETPGKLAEYERDIREQYLTCRYSPFSASGAMLGYLLTGTASETLTQIAVKLQRPLETVRDFPGRPHRLSTHKRSVPAGKPYPADFSCHHLILEYLGVKRSSQ